MLFDNLHCFVGTTQISNIAIISQNGVIKNVNGKFMIIKSLNKKYEKKYKSFLLKIPYSLLFNSLAYKKLLESYLNCKSNYLIAVNHSNDIIGSFPLMIKQNNKYGSVANSLPFYGSNGSMIIDPDLSSELQEDIRNELLIAGEKYIEDNKCIASTIITNPLDPNRSWFEKNWNYTVADERIGQLTTLPSISQSTPEKLMSSFHPKTRNMVRKAMKSGVKVNIEHNEDAIDFLHKIHLMNMKVIGGKAKKKRFFDLVTDYFEKDQYRIYIANLNGQKIAALLLLYFNKTVEYYTPVILNKYRKFQPLSLIIFQAMQDAVNESYELWNWGGTWLSQKSVYRFKKRWGTEAFKYKYFTKIYNNDILYVKKEVLIEEYTDFYVAPFYKLKKNNEGSSD